MGGVIVNSGSRIGDFCILNTYSFLENNGDMYNYSSLSSGVRIGDNLTLMECNALCVGATVFENIVIDNDTVIGAGARVNKTFPVLWLHMGFLSK